MDQQIFKDLVEKYVRGSATEEEIKIIYQWYDSFDDSTVWLDENEQLLKARLFEKIKRKDATSVETNIAIPISRKKTNNLWYAAAAIIFLGISIGIIQTLKRQNSNNRPELVQAAKIKAGSNKATLTLSNGKVMALGGAQARDVRDKNDNLIAINTNRGLDYQRKSSRKASLTDEKNTLTTARGGQYSVVLSDGTKVWLNAASSITYPIKFSGNERNVEITGEAYFEVAKDAFRPFRVSSAMQVVEVLGTHFNINAYGDEPSIRTTLLEGKVKVTAGHEQTFLTPGQQAQLGSTGLTMNSNADIEESTAWRNGYFVFNHEHIESIMRKISRWYDVDVTYQGNISKDWFGGSLSRYNSAAEVLNTLEQTGQIHFKVEGRRIIVLQ